MLHQLRRIVLLPLLPILAEIPRKGLFSPGTRQRVRNGRPRADALVLARVLEIQRQGAVSAHGVARNGHAFGVQLLEVGEDDVGQLVGDVRLHLVVLGPRLLRGVDVKGRAAAKVPGVVLARVVRPARGRVRVEQRQLEGRGVGVEEALFGGVVRGAGQAGEVDEQRGRVGGGDAGGEEQREVHGAAGDARLVGELEEAAAKGVDGGVGGDVCHGVLVFWCFDVLMFVMG